MRDWDRNHEGKFSSLMDKTILEEWKIAKSKNVKYKDPIPVLLTEVDFAKEKESNIKPYAYASRIIRLIIEGSENNECILGYVSPSGVLMKVFGNPAGIQWAKEHTIQPNTSWGLECLGPNAVGMGMKTLTATVSAGMENYNQNLSDIAIYYYPLYLLNGIEVSAGNGLSLYGGVVLFAPDKNVNYMELLRAAALDISVHMYMTRTLYNVFSRVDMGMICFDISQVTGTISISYYNKEVFDVLGVKEKNWNFIHAEDVFSPEKNKELYSIIRKLKKKKDYEIQLCINDRTRTYLISTDVYRQTHLSVVGIRVYITSPQHETKKISRKLGNNAILTIDNLIGESGVFKETKEQLRMCAKNNANVLILGESGVGKDIAAQAIHNASERKEKPFIALNCGALPRDLIASELFGYEDGAYTGSRKGGNMGKFELANGGTIFLDEIGEMPLDLQAMLLRVIEQKSFMRVGGNKTIHVDVKIISATNANLLNLVEQHKFRLDLYYRLSILKLNIPPLRVRGEDVLLLAEYFIDRFEKQTNGYEFHTVLTADAKEYLLRRKWQGNVRELQNTIEGIMLLYHPMRLDAELLKQYMGDFNSKQTVDPVREDEYVSLMCDNKRKADDEVVNASPVMIRQGEKKRKPSQMDKELIEKTLMEHRFSKTETAKALGISRKTLYKKIEEFKIQ